MTTPQCIHIPDGSVAISGELFDHFCDLERVLAVWQRLFRECEAEHDNQHALLLKCQLAINHVCREILTDARSTQFDALNRELDTFLDCPAPVERQGTGTADTVSAGNEGAIPSGAADTETLAGMRRYIFQQLGFLTDDDNRPAEGLIRLAAKRLARDRPA